MILDHFRLDGRVAIVTGAGQGIGRGIAIGLAEAGADVVIGARTAADLDEVAAQVRGTGRRSRPSSPRWCGSTPCWSGASRRRLRAAGDGGPGAPAASEPLSRSSDVLRTQTGPTLVPCTVVGPRP